PAAVAALPLPARKPPPKPVKPARKEAAPTITAPAVEPQPEVAAVETVGDRYLNAVRDRITRFRKYPEAARSRQLRGRPVFAVLIDRRGALLGLVLERSSGYELLDQAAANAIRAAAPLPAVPKEILGPTVEFVIAVDLYP
ncbi:MAG: energy transducer TonB, partial [Dongiaceae bacterium]